MFSSGIGSRLGPYRLVELIGQGGMSAVYRAVDDEGNEVALKVLHYVRGASTELVARFEREAQVLTELRHPHVVPTLSYAMGGANPYIALRLLRGGTLTERLDALTASGRFMPVTDVLRVARQITQALVFAHDNGLVHRDIKADNILFDLEGRAYLSDFGLVKMLGATRHTVTGGMVGTPAYMSPEQAMGKDGDARSDLYALGVLLYQMATGVLPFVAEQPLAVVLQHINDAPAPPSVHNPAIPSALEALILRLMAKDPLSRAPNAAGVAVELEAMARSTAGCQADARAAGPGTHDPSGRRRRLARIPALLVLLVVLLVAGNHLAGQGRLPTASPTSAASATREARSSLLKPTPAIMLLSDATAAEPAVAPIPGRLPAEVAGEGGVTPIDGAAADAATARDGLLAAADAGASETETAPESLTATPIPSPTASTTPTIARSAEEGDVSALGGFNPSAVATPTPDATATYVANCAYQIELSDTYTLLPGSRDAFADREFDVAFTLRNVGNCRLPTGLIFRPIESDTFQVVQRPVLTEPLPVSAERTLTARLRAPAVQARVYDTWHLVTLEGQTYGNPVTFFIDVYPVPTPTPTPTPTPVDRPIDLTYSVAECAYQEAEWRCLLYLQPYGGGGGPYVIEVFDATPSVTYRDVVDEQPHWIAARRCDPWVKEIRVALNSEAGEQLRRTVVIDPQTDPGIVAALGGACTLP